MQESIGSRPQGWKIRDKQVWTAKSLINETYTFKVKQR